MLILLFVAGAIVATGGIGYVVLKNKQVTARRDITKVQQRMEEHRVAITFYQSDFFRELKWVKIGHDKMHEKTIDGWQEMTM